jgi:PhnB protein
MQTIYPYLLYDDAATAIDFLSRAFGFVETFRSEHGDRISHAQMKLGESEVMLGQPQESRRGDGQSVLLYVYVDDVDAHCERARSAGASIEQEPRNEEYGHRTYNARDPEGHSWYFAQVLNN